MLTLAGNNTYTGGTRVSGGTLQLGSNSALGTGGVTANAGVLDLNSYGISIPTLSGVRRHDHRQQRGGRQPHHAHREQLGQLRRHAGGRRPRPATRPGHERRGHSYALGQQQHLQRRDDAQRRHVGRGQRLDRLGPRLGHRDLERRHPGRRPGTRLRVAARSSARCRRAAVRIPSPRGRPCPPDTAP